MVGKYFIFFVPEIDFFMSLAKVFGREHQTIIVDYSRLQEIVERVGSCDDSTLPLCLRQISKDDEVEILIADGYFVLDGYCKEGIDVNNTIVSAITFLECALSISSIHVLLSTYNSQARIIADYLDQLHTCVYTHYIPYYSHDICNGPIDPKGRYLYFFFSYIQWVESRFPGYFSENSMEILEDAKAGICTTSEEELCEKVFCAIHHKLDLHLAQQTDVVPVRELLVTNNLYCIPIKYCQHIDEMSYVGQLFAKMIDRVIWFTDIQSFRAQSIASNNSICPTPQPILPIQIAQLKKTSHRAFTNDGRILTYWSIGKGEPIVIVNAFGAKSAAWNNLIDLLACNHAVYVWDIGCISDNLYHPHICDLHTQISDMHTIIDTERLSQFHIVAWCSGVKSAITYAHNCPKKVLTMTLIAGDYAPYIGCESAKSKFMDSMPLIDELAVQNPRMLNHYIHMIADGAFNRASANYATNNASILEIIPEHYRPIFLSHFESMGESQVFFRMCAEYYHHDISDMLSKITVPTLVIACENDNVVPYAQSVYAFNQIPTARMHVLPGATHLAMLERAREIAYQLNRHINISKLLSLSTKELG